ncbi:MAG: hypothetical protein ACI9S6_001359 [Reinekea sp.]|jgi:hypothetical protein
MAFKLVCQLNEAGYSLYPSLGAMTIAYKLAFVICKLLHSKPQIFTSKAQLWYWLRSSGSNALPTVTFIARASSRVARAYVCYFKQRHLASKLDCCSTRHLYHEHFECTYQALAFQQYFLECFYD